MNILKRNKKLFKKSITCLLPSLSLFCLSSAARMSKYRQGFSLLPSFLSYLEELLKKQQKEADQDLKNKIIDQHKRVHSNLYKVLDDKRGIEWLKETLPYIPLAPHRVYKDEGFSWDGFFGSY